jgi:hypothetical protein
MLTPKGTKMSLEYIKNLTYERFLSNFVTESNKIEGITDPEVIEDDLKRTRKFLSLSKITLKDLNEYNTAGKLRNKKGMNVQVGAYYPNEGGIFIEKQLKVLIKQVNEDVKLPFWLHIAFETLHPYTDGNGRTGRVLWAWQMITQEGYDLSLGFLHEYYYQSFRELR